MNEKELAKLKEKIIKNIDIHKDANEAWSGSFVLADGYRISYAAAPEMKMHTAKAKIKENLVDLVIDVAAIRNCAIFND